MKCNKGCILKLCNEHDDDEAANRHIQEAENKKVCLHDVCKTIPGLLNLLIPQVLLSERQCSCEEMTSGIGSAQNTWQQSGHNTVFRTVSTQTPQHFQLYPVTRLTLSSERVLLWLRPVRINSTNESVSCLHRSSASLHVCVTKTPKFSISAKERSERAPSRQRHDETSSNTRHTHTHGVREQCRPTARYLWETRRMRLTLTRVHWLQNNAKTQSLTAGTQEWGNEAWLSGYDTALARPVENWYLAHRASQLLACLCAQTLCRHTHTCTFEGFEVDKKVLEGMRDCEIT